MPRREACSKTLKEYVPEPLRLRVPFGWIWPYSSFTIKTAVREFTPKAVSLIFSEKVTGTSLPFGGHKTFGVAEMVTTGGVLSGGALLFSSTPTETLPNKFPPQ